VYSVDYACAACGLSFEPPSPQLFSFNSPQGMCLQCDGLGDLYTFADDLLVPDSSLTFEDGCIELLGPWKDMGRWRRHIYQGVADTVERVRELPAGTLLETPWSQLAPELRDVWLWGTGDLHITFTWRGGSSPIKYGGRWEGVVPDLLSKYRNSKSIPQRRQLEKYMRTLPCQACQGERLNPQARSVRLTTSHPRFVKSRSLSIAEICRLAIRDTVDFFERPHCQAGKHSAFGWLGKLDRV
jgi:excinuclease ABC subunit A